MKIILGLSGGIGSGKSTIASLFAKKGALTIDADQLAHQKLESNSVKENLKSRFGHGIIKSDGSVNRSRLAEIVFENKDDLAFLEHCIHPGVREEIESQVKNSRESLIVLDVPLLETSPLRKLCTHKAFIKVPEEERFKRASSRGWTQKEWKQRENNQVSLKEKEADADWIIDNSKDLKHAEQQISNWLEAQQDIT